MPPLLRRLMVILAALGQVLSTGEGRRPCPSIQHQRGCAWSTGAGAGPPQYKRDVDVLGEVQRGGIKILKGLEPLCCGERLRELGLHIFHFLCLFWKEIPKREESVAVASISDTPGAQGGSPRPLLLCHRGAGGAGTAQHPPASTRRWP